ncbi:MAG: hypothetical protein M3P49_07100 [Actinomycetota bacterium]|nr:hypothetical protein [Actinomycetota bacterium]
MTCLVLGARRYSFDGGGGQTVEGCTLFVVYPEDQQLGEEYKGLFPFSQSGNLDAFHQLDQLPGEYQLEVRKRPGPKGKPQDTVVGVSYVGAASVAGAPNGTHG